MLPLPWLSLNLMADMKPTKWRKKNAV